MGTVHYAVPTAKGVAQDLILHNMQFSLGRDYALHSLSGQGDRLGPRTVQCEIELAYTVHCVVPGAKLLA